MTFVLQIHGGRYDGIRDDDDGDYRDDDDKDKITFRLQMRRRRARSAWSMGWNMQETTHRR